MGFCPEARASRLSAVSSACPGDVRPVLPPYASRLLLSGHDVSRGTQHVVHRTTPDHRLQQTDANQPNSRSGLPRRILLPCASHSTKAKRGRQPFVALLRGQLPFKCEQEGNSSFTPKPNVTYLGQESLSHAPSDLVQLETVEKISRFIYSFLTLFAVFIAVFFHQTHSAW